MYGNLSGAQGATVPRRDENQPIPDVDLTAEEPRIPTNQLATVGEELDENLSGAQGATVPRRDENQPIPDVDLTADEPRIPTNQLATVGEFQRRILSTQERVRTSLAVGAFASLVAVLVFLIASVYNKITVDNIEKIATVVVTPLTGIVGTIIGFYFAERRSGGTRE